MKISKAGVLCTLLLVIHGCAVDDQTQSVTQAITGPGPTIQVSLTEVGDPPPNTRLQFQPAVSFFGDPSAPTWIVCYNDDTHRADAEPNASGISCSTVDGNGNRSPAQPIWTQWPFGTGNPNTFSDCALARDPGNPNVVWIVALADWNSATAGNRRSVGEAKLVFDPTCANCIDELNHAHDHTCLACPSHFDLVEPSPGFFGPGDRMVPIAADGIEGPVDDTKGPSPDRPTIAIDPVADASGNHQHYIAFFQNDNSTVPSRGRILVARRNDPAERYWSSPVAAFANGLAGTDGWVNDTIQHTQFEAPQIAVANNHQVGVGYVRLQLIGQAGDPSIVNDITMSIQPIDYFFGVSNDLAATPFSATSIRSETTPSFDSEPGTVATGAPGEQFTYPPSPSLVFDSILKRWVMALPTNNIGSGGSTGGWDFRVFASTTVPATHWNALPVVPSPLPADTSNRVFPTLSFDASSSTFLVSYLEATDAGRAKWEPAFNSFVEGASAWSAAQLFAGPSVITPVDMGEVTWGGFWGAGGGGHLSGMPRNGNIGDYCGQAAANGSFFFAWPDSRTGPTSSPPVNTMDVFGVIFH